MKKVIIATSFLAVAAFIACKGTSYATTIDKYEVTQQQVDAAKKRWSESDIDKIKKGKSIFTHQCVECHKAFVVESMSERKWKHEIEDMSPKAKLTEEEKMNLTYFVLSYWDTKQVAK